MPTLRRSGSLGAVAIALLAPGFVRADVADSAANGFTVKLVLTIPAPPQVVYQRLVHNIGDWWDPAHTFSGDAQNLSIDDKPMGCFCEKLPHGGGVRHLEVVNVDPEKVLVLTGGLGPLQAMAVTGSLTIQLAPLRDDGTKVAVTYTVGGYSPDGLSALAAPVDAVLTQQFMRLKSFVQTGRPLNEKSAPK